MSVLSRMIPRYFTCVENSIVLPERKSGLRNFILFFLVKSMIIVLTGFTLKHSFLLTPDLCHTEHLLYYGRVVAIPEASNKYD